MSAVQKRFAIVQSNYIPWKGYFDLIGMVDEFILYDTVQYTTRDWRNRNRIKTPCGAQWLTIPVRHERREQTILETCTDGSAWRQGHWKTIQRYYAHAGYWKRYCDEIEALYLDERSESLSEINHAFLVAICGWLNIRTPIRCAQAYAPNPPSALSSQHRPPPSDFWLPPPDHPPSTLGHPTSDLRPLTSDLCLSCVDVAKQGTPTSDFRLPTSALPPSPSARLISLLQAAGASDYLSGPAAKAYLDQAAFTEAGIRVHWMDYGGYPEYRQLWPPFEASVSVLDLILNEGPAASKFMKFSSRNPPRPAATPPVEGI